MAGCGEGGTKAGLSGGHAGGLGRAYPAWGATVGLLVGVRLMRVAVGGGVVVVALRGWRASSVLFFLFGDPFLAVRSCCAVCLFVLFVCLGCPYAAVRMFECAVSFCSVRFSEFLNLRLARGGAPRSTAPHGRRRVVTFFKKYLVL